jgi:hypothetical protein
VRRPIQVRVAAARSLTAPAVGIVLAGALLLGCSSADDPSADATAPLGDAVVGATDEPPQPTSPGTASEGASAGTGESGTSDTGSQSEPGGAGDGTDVVASGDAGEIEVSEPVRIDEEAEAAAGVVVSLVEIRAGESKAIAPGEIGGPALIVTVAVTNDTGKRISLDSSFVSLVDGDGIVAIPSPSEPARPLAGRLARGATAKGVYVFTTPSDARKNITVYVSPTAGVPVVQFVGDAK